jgi:hypothetical protein
MAAQFTVKVDKAWPQVKHELQQIIFEAADKALRETASNAVDQGRQNIASAGRFGANWQRDLQFRMQDEQVGGEASPDVKAIVFHKSALAGIFESGATIAGKPLLWIPTIPGAPPIKRSGKRLTFAIVAGHHLAFDKDDRDRHRRPLYFGVPVVHIAQKWRITEITKEQVDQFPLVFSKYFKGD